MVGSYTEDLKKPTTVEIGEWALVQGWTLAQDNTVYFVQASLSIHAVQHLRPEYSNVQHTSPSRDDHTVLQSY